MKLWFVEPKPNVFVSGVKNSVAVTVIDYLYKHCPQEFGIIMFRSLPRLPGYEIRNIGTTPKDLTIITGLQLVIETLKLNSPASAFPVASLSKQSEDPDDNRGCGVSSPS